MKGNNAMELNEATMIEAVQFWLEAQFREGRAPKVVGVALKDDMTPTFEIELTDRDSN